MASVGESSKLSANAAEKLPGFSRLSGNFEDEEELERERINRDATKLFKTAEDAYFGTGSRAGALELFEQAETCMAPLLRAGLTDLVPKELERVLRGRLHQAVLLAQLPEAHNRWPRVGRLVEDVLQFDFQNCHARWIRGLWHRSQRRQAEADDEFQKAVQFARVQGKDSQAEQWEAELRKGIAGEAGEAEAEVVDADDTAEEDADEQGVTGDEKTTIEKAAIEKASTEKAAAAEAIPTTAAQPRSTKEAPAGMQRGFFNRKPRKATTESAVGAGISTAPAAEAPVLQDDHGRQQQQQQQREWEEQQQDERRQHQAELESLRKQLQEERARHLREEQALEARQQKLVQEVNSIGLEFEQVVACEREQSIVHESTETILRHLEAPLTTIRQNLEACREWSEGEHQSYLDLSTEVLTLREMTTRELRDKREQAAQQASDAQHLTCRIGELKAAARTLREHVKKANAEATGHEPEHDMQGLAHNVADFHELPARVKIGILVNDSAFIQLMVVMAILGMLCMLAIASEAFGVLQCRFVCSQ
mmetsp:Transcript_113912/g.221174  ORF Transcript_113912/g.221174 Transcript_113912/m.221174 type:complete len:537 (-) Transcript_113912:60-1670(-)